MLGGCVSLSLVSPSFNYNNNYSEGNPNRISCDPGGFFSYPNCSIPISRFVAITAQYADPLNNDALIAYANENNSFVFDDINKITTLDKLNKMFYSKPMSGERFHKLPQYFQERLEKMRDTYIPENDFKKIAHTYIYAFTLNTIHFAVTPCNNPTSQVDAPYDKEKYEQLYLKYKVFSIQFTNDILRHIGSSYFHFDTEYENEDDLYEHLYTKILKLNPSQIVSLAQKIYAQTNAEEPTFESSFYTKAGLTFGTIGTFKCTTDLTSWDKYGSDYFGLNVSGVRMLVHFKNRDVFANTDSHKMNIMNN